MSQLEKCVRLRELFLEFCRTTRLWNGLSISSVCSLHGVNFSGFRSCSRLPLPPLWSWGQFIYSSEGGAGAQSESGLGNQSALLWGIPGAQTHDPSWKRIFQKIPFGHGVVTAPFWVHGQGAWSGVFCPKPFSVCPSFSPSRGWGRSLQKEPGLMETSFSCKP